MSALDSFNTSAKRTPPQRLSKIATTEDVTRGAALPGYATASTEFPSSHIFSHSQTKSAAIAASKTVGSRIWGSHNKVR